MAFDWQSVVNIVIASMLAAIGWLYTQAIQEQKTLRQMLNDIRVDLPMNYVSKEDMTSHLKRIENMLIKIQERLDEKADKR